jgi:integrase
LPRYNIEMDNTLTSLTGLLKRGSTFYFQARVPVDCQAHYPKAIIKERLPANDLATAKALVVQRWTELHAEYARIRATGSKSKTQISPADAQRIISLAVESRLKADDEWRDAGVDDFDYQRMEELHADADQSERLSISRGQLDVHARAVTADWLIAHGYQIQEDSPEFIAFGRQLMKAQVAATRAMESRHRGEQSDTPEIMAKVNEGQIKPKESSAPLLSKVVGYFLDNYDQTIPMFAKHRATLQLLLKCIPDVPVARLKQMDIEDFAKLLCKLPPRWSDIARRTGRTPAEIAAMNQEEAISPKTFEYTYLASLRPFLAESRRIFGDVGFPAHLTTEGLKYRGSRKEGESKQRAFTEGELKRLFEGPEMLAYARSKSDHPKYWLPLLGLFTGARVNEICQLNPHSDIREEGGVWIFNFTEEGETDARITRRIKNASSVRTVPIHPELIALGFLKYVESVRVKDNKLLFPQWTPSKGKASYAAEKWFRVFLTEAGLRDETPGKNLVGMHAFRHTFLNRALNLGVLGAEALTGHVSGKSAVVRGYEGELGLKNKLAVLSQIKFDIAPPKPE